MHVVQISFFVDREGRLPSKQLEDWFALSDIASAVDSAGARVSVIQASKMTDRIEQSGVTYHFVAPEKSGGLLAASKAFRALLRDLSADVIHIHGLSFSRQVIELRKLVPKTPILLQDHADRVPRRWQRRIWRQGMSAASGISFCARAQAGPFERAGLFACDLPIFEIPESTSPFIPGDRSAAQHATGLSGDPAVLWIGHLNRNKDPLTVLDGVSAAVSDLPNLKLWCCYVSAPLLRTVETRIAQDPRLRERVHLLGRIQHDRIELHMQAADLFVLGSHREGSSFSLIEAMATGLTPVATDIPSVHALTGGGTVGSLWPPGDSRALSEALRITARNLGPGSREKVRAHFDTRLSSTAIGQRFITAYDQLIGLDTKPDAWLEATCR